jgi:hypothetical protein
VLLCGHGAHAGGLEQRVAELEVSAEQTREQLASLLSQQDELKGLLARLLEGLEGAGLSTPAGANSSIKALTKTVRVPRRNKTLWCDVCCLMPGELLAVLDTTNPDRMSSVHCQPRYVA